MIAAELGRAGFEQSWLPVVKNWIGDILQTKLGAENAFSLAAVSASNRVNEMGFYFPLTGMRAGRLNQILKAFSYPPLPNQHEVPEGLMVGFRTPPPPPGPITFQVLTLEMMLSGSALLVLF